MRLKIGKEFTTPFSTTKELRQGCCLSPTLFKIYLDRALVKWVRKGKSMGLKIGDYLHCFLEMRIPHSRQCCDIRSYPGHRHDKRSKI